MANLGKSLVFYLKHAAEMERLYTPMSESDEKPKLQIDGVEDAQQVLSMVKRVGDAASREAGDFLNKCSKQIEEHLNSFGRAKRCRSKPEECWEVWWRLYPKKRSNRRFSLGVGIYELDRTIVPWVLSQGGRRAADEILRILKRGERGREVDPNYFGTGCVVLDRISVSIPDTPGTFVVDQEPLIHRVVQAMALGAKEAEEIAAIGN